MPKECHHFAIGTPTAGTTTRSGSCPCHRRVRGWGSENGWTGSRFTIRYTGTPMRSRGQTGGAKPVVAIRQCEERLHLPNHLNHPELARPTRGHTGERVLEHRRLIRLPARCVQVNRAIDPRPPATITRDGPAANPYGVGRGRSPSRHRRSRAPARHLGRPGRRRIPDDRAVRLPRGSRRSVTSASRSSAIPTDEGRRRRPSAARRDRLSPRAVGRPGRTGAGAPHRHHRDRGGHAVGARERRSRSKWSRRRSASPHRPKR